MVRFVQRYEALWIHRADMDCFLGLASHGKGPRKSRVVYDEDEDELELEGVAAAMANSEVIEVVKEDEAGRPEEEDEAAEGEKVQLKGDWGASDAKEHVVYPNPMLLITQRPKAGVLRGLDIISNYGTTNLIPMLHVYLKNHATQKNYPTTFLPTTHHKYNIWHCLDLYHQPLPLDPENVKHDIDAFTWNLNNPVIKPEIFTQSLCDDLQIPLATPILLKSHLGRNATSIGEEWWRGWRRKVAGGTITTHDKADDGLADEEDKTVSEVPVKLDVIVGTMNLTDHFEWDINNPNNSPEEFAKVYCHDLRLGGKFKMAIAHSICEQASVYQKLLLLVSHLFDGMPIADDELCAVMLPLIEHSFRFDQMLLEQLTPQLNALQEGKIEHNKCE
ncbi:SWI/SNF chromatin-remodeling complex subunit [Ceratobasidium sp. 370]|nr:SWI/SNF chromatin-remodeling complex subunit [Ceratobasidium sp. 370]